MLPFTYYEYDENKKKEAKEKESQEREAQSQDPFAKSKALGVGSLMTASSEELHDKFISKHENNYKSYEEDDYDGPVRSHILPRDSWNVLDGPRLS